MEDKAVYKQEWREVRASGVQNITPPRRRSQLDCRTVFNVGPAHRGPDKCERTFHSQRRSAKGRHRN